MADPPVENSLHRVSVFCEPGLSDYSNLDSLAVTWTTSVFFGQIPEKIMANFSRRASGKSGFTPEQMVQSHAHGIDVSPCIDVLRAPYLFR